MYNQYVLFRSFYESPWTAFDASYWTVKDDFWTNSLGTWTDSNGTEIDRPGTYFLNWFLIGVKSKHDGDTEDRKFKFFYVKSTNYIIRNCVDGSISTYEQDTLEVPSSGQSLNWGKYR